MNDEHIINVLFEALENWPEEVLEESLKRFLAYPKNEINIELEAEKAFRAGFEYGLATDLEVDDAWSEYENN